MTAEVVGYPLSVVSDFDYRVRVRPIRLTVVSGGTIILAGTLYRAFLSGLAGWFFVALPPLVFSGAFLLWLAIFRLGTPPIHLDVSRDCLRFRRRTGSLLVLNRRAVEKWGELQEYLERQNTSGFGRVKGVDHYLRYRFRLVGLTPEAYQAIHDWLDRPGCVLVETPIGRLDLGWKATRVRTAPEHLQA